MKKEIYSYMKGGRIYYEDVEVGKEIPSLIKGPMTNAHIMRWAAFMENWHLIHYDRVFAVENNKLPNVLVNGSWKQHVLMQFLKDWVGLTGWVWKVDFQFRDMDLPGDILTAWGTIKKKYERNGLGYVEIIIGIRNSRSIESTKGTAVVIVPKRDGKEIPYPLPFYIGEGV
jgi:acyl dehydratase